MKLLLDTHSFLWFVDGSSRLSRGARALIEDEANDLLFSVGSVWELAIKISLGKLHIAQDFEPFLVHQLSLNSIDLLGITVAHAAAVIALPFHHRDPFDRLLIAQATIEQIPILSDDPAFDSYPITRLW